MSVANKNGSAANASSGETTRMLNGITALDGLQVVRDIAWGLAMKYKWDPVLGGAHEEYLSLLNNILMKCNRD